MQRVANGSLMPTDQLGIDYINSLKVGKALGVTVVQARNYKFHQKIIMLLQFCYDALPGVIVELDGKHYELSFDTFRRQMVAKSGHHNVVVTMEGNLRVEPQSISYKDCSEELAQQIYSDVLNKALEELGAHQHKYTRDELDGIVNELMRFD